MSKSILTPIPLYSSHFAKASRETLFNTFQESSKLREIMQEHNRPVSRTRHPALVKAGWTF